MGINGRVPEPRPRARGLADQLQKRVDDLLPWGEAGEPDPRHWSDLKKPICQAVGEMIETETLALGVEWGKRFAQLQNLAEDQTELLGRLLDRVEQLEGPK